MRCMCKDFQPCVMSSRSTAKNLFYDSFLSIRCKVKQYVRAVCDFTQCVSYYTQTQYAIVHKFVNCKYNLRYFGAKLSLSEFSWKEFKSWNIVRFINSSTYMECSIIFIIVNSGLSFRNWLIVSKAESCESGCWKFEKWKVKWKSGSLISRSEKWNENLVHSFREWKVKWKSLAIEIENEKWNENGARSRSRMKSEMKMPWNRDREVKFLEKFLRIKKSRKF